MQGASGKNKHCKRCNRPDEAEDMVCCDACDAWEHYGCAGVSGSIAGSDRSWICEECRRKLLAAADSNSAPSTYTSTSSKKSRQIQLRLDLLEQQNQIRIRKLEEQEKFLKEKYEMLMLLEEEEAPSNRSRVSARSKRDRLENWLNNEDNENSAGEYEATHTVMPESGVQEQNMLAAVVGLSLTNPALETQSVSRKLEAPVMFELKPVSNPTPLKITSHAESSLVPSSSKATRLEEPRQQYISSVQTIRPSASVSKPSRTLVQERTNDAIASLRKVSHEDSQQTCKYRLPTGPVEPDIAQFGQSSEGFAPTQPMPVLNQDLWHNQRNSYVDPVLPCPTASQLAARQVMARDLPVFSGDPEDWPIFYSSFKNSTAICGYSDAENLARLQRSLKGNALDTVRSRLLIPSAVASVIDTLRMLFGRPEILLNSLLRRVRSSPAPKADNLKSIVDYGLSVQYLIDHMVMSEQQTHLTNPLLLNELVEKLPTHFKLQWSSFKQTQADVNLVTFNSFMSNLVSLASDLLVTSEAYYGSTKGYRPDKHKEKLFVHSNDQSDEANDETTERNQERSIKGCNYCEDESHQISNCHEFRLLSVDARWKTVRSKNLCRTCLVPHRKWPCRSKKECGLENCRSRHHPMLHAQHTQHEQIQPQVDANVQAHQNHHGCHSASLFRYLPVKLFANGRTVTIFAFLDEGSSSTLLEAEVAAQLGLDGPSASFWLTWTGNIKREEKGSKSVSLTIAGENSKQKYAIDNILTVEDLHLPKQSFNYESLVDQYPHLKGIPLQSYSNVAPRMIIGLEHVRLLTALKIHEGTNEGPVVVKTRLGWCVFGKESNNAQLVHLNHHVQETMTNQSLHEAMRSYFAVEESAVTVKPEADEDKRAVQILERTTIKRGCRYETGLLWRVDSPSFPDSLPMAKSRLKSLERRLARDPELAKNVQQQIESYIAKGYAHKASLEELQDADPRHVWYLPLGVVVNPRKAGKIRLIWDAAAKVQGISFNDLLLKGPDMLVSLVAVVLRFRERNIAVCGDICEMFHQIEIRLDDKQYQRFLWRSDPNSEIEVYVMDVATFGATCSPCSAQYIKNVNAEAHAAMYPRAASAITKNHYVDDLLDSTDTVEEAIELVNQVKIIHSTAGFKIRKFRSNSPEVLLAIGESEELSGKPINCDKQIIGDRVLGLLWDPAEDVFTFDASSLNSQQLLNGNVIPTKRQVLQLIMRIFDPLGFVSHFTIHGKILMQEIWRAGTNWDEPIAENLLDAWYRWSELLAHIGEIRIPRCYFADFPSNTLQQLQVHIFVDASESAYACVAYLRIDCSGGRRCAFVASKTKVAPLKPLSIPRMELQAAMIGARLMQSLCSSLSLPIFKRCLWTDSSTVLAWLRSDSRKYHQFVGFRVGEILSLTTLEEWKYVPSDLNVADEATKWSSGPTFDNNNRWFSGPGFLIEDENEWPEELRGSSKSITSEELRPAFLHRCSIMVPLVDVTRFSNWKRLVRTVAYVHRAVSILRQKIPAGERGSPLKGTEILTAEFTLLRQAQAEAYPDEIAALINHEPVITSSPLYRLNPFMDTCGLIRMGSRIEAAPEAPYSAKYPVVLPKQHSITTLVTDSFHRRLLHGNHETVHNEMRQQYYISGLRSLIRKVSRNCQFCKIRNATPKPPMMAPLPKVRLTPFVRAFTFVGVDYFGPVEVKIGRSLVKRWVALFTCLTVRAIHLEVTHSLSAQSCVMAFRRFIARRGAPREVYSDNGTNFVGANRQLTEEQQKMQQINHECASTFTNAHTTWHFNVPAAPHMGGPWERLVRSVKSAMKVISDSTPHPSDEMLETILLEAEGVINSRPLTYVPLDQADSESLTPNHFLLYGSTGITQPEIAFVDKSSGLRDIHKATQRVVDKFWARWVVEYLPMLTRRTKWFEKVKPLEPGDLVVIIDERTRNSWTRGRILETITGANGQVRRAKVLTANGIVSRPAVKLALLDVNSEKTNNTDSYSGTPGAHGLEDVAELTGHKSDATVKSPEREEIEE